MSLPRGTKFTIGFRKNTNFSPIAQGVAKERIDPCITVMDKRLILNDGTVCHRFVPFLETSTKTEASHGTILTGIRGDWQRWLKFSG